MPPNMPLNDAVNQFDNTMLNVCYSVSIKDIPPIKSEASPANVVSSWSNFVLAIVAISGLLGRAIWNWCTRPRIRIQEAKKYSFRRNLLAEDRNSGDNDCGGYEYLIPVVNNGRQLATDVTAFIDCVLKRSGDGDQFEEMYFGLPRRLSWADSNCSINIAKNEIAYISFSQLVTSIQSENTKGADVEPSLTCYIKAIGCSQDDLLLVSQSSAITVLSRMCVRAKNSSVTHTRWISLHWAGGTELKEVSDKNFKIRLANADEIKQADSQFTKLVAAGEVRT